MRFVAVQEGSDRVEMDIGYGAVVDDTPTDKELVETRRSDTEESKVLVTNGAAAK